jgi:hypothetical protein
MTAVAVEGGGMRGVRRDLRFLKIYAGATTLALVFVAAAAFRQAAPSRQRFDEIDVQRINVVEADGRVRLVIANSARQAVTVIDGKQILPRRQRDAGLIFFNDEGDENGGMTWSGRSEHGTARANAGLSFDQYKQDETVTLRYAQQGTDRTAGLTVADRPEASLAVAERLNDATTDEARAKVRQELVDSGAVGSRPRMFAGKHADGTASLALSDGSGKSRLVLSVEKSGAAKIEFLDAKGKVTRAIRPN